jgi:uncharacterized protein (TIGR00290 family)
MTDKTAVVFAWSGGKDSAFALHQLQKDERYAVRYLLSTINGNNGRLSMHGIREELIEAQAAATGIPLLKVYVYEGNNPEYERRMGDTLLKVKAEGISAVAFGDIFLEDLRIYRENQMKQVGMDCLFPIWKKDTHKLVRDFIAGGFKTLICCVNDGFLDESYCGRLLDGAFIAGLPARVDPCGENGEFHSFCFDGPVFRKAVPVSIGEKLYMPLAADTAGHAPLVKIADTRGFWYCDLLLRDQDVSGIAESGAYS